MKSTYVWTGLGAVALAVVTTMVIREQEAPVSHTQGRVIAARPAGQSAPPKQPVDLGSSAAGGFDNLPHRVGFSSPASGGGAASLGAGQIEVLTAQLDAIRREVAVLRAEVTRQGELWRSAQLEAGPVDPEGELDSETRDLVAAYEADERVAEEVRAAEYHTDVAAIFAQEWHVNEWAGDTATRLEDAVAASQVSGATVLGIDCRSTLCRVEMEYTNSEVQAEFESSLPVHVAAFLPTMTVDTDALDDGVISSVFYLARTGYRLPDG